MQEDNKNLEEVVVVGFGTQKKANLTGAVAAVDNKLLDNRPLTNLSSGLAGLLPGVSVVQTSGQPGQDVGNIHIRGIGSLNECGPLVIIDGFEGSMNDVNPNDVASISVLKDAASSSIYGGTYNLFGVTMKKMGIECTFVDQTLPAEELEKYFKPNTKAVFGETITNPTVSIFDFEKFAKLAHSHGVPLIVDNTFATPINCRPFEWGADIVTHSTTKYIDGHGVSVGGCIVDSGNFDWNKYADKFPGLTTPDDSYHGITYTERFGKGAYITKATAQLMRDFGAIQSPQNSFYVNLGLETLHLRMERHCANALAVAKYLKNHEKIAWVHYAGLEDDEYYEMAQKYMPKGTCGVLAFGLKGGRSESIAFMDKLKLASIATHVADSKTCLLHPASHTHRQLTEQQLEEAGVSPDLIRLSVGIEDVDDLIADLEQALNA